MGKKILVEAGLQLGERLLALLDDAKFPISAAVWVLNERYDDGKLILGTPLYEREGPREAYGQLIDAVRKEDPASTDFQDIELRSNRDPFMKDLRRRFGKMKPVKGIEVGSQHLGDEWFSDAIVYRIK